MSDFVDTLVKPLEALRDWTLQFANYPTASLWLLGLSFAESSFFPIPPDLLLIAMGLTDAARANPGVNFLYALICSVGSVLGGMLGYAIGYYGGRPVAEWLFKKRRIDTVERMYAKYDVWAVAIAGFTPVPYKVFTITTGVLRGGFWRFVIASAASRSARFFLVATLLYFFADKTRDILEKHIGPATLILVAVAVLGFLVINLLVRKKGKEEDAAPDPPTPESEGDA